MEFKSVFNYQSLLVRESDIKLFAFQCVALSLLNAINVPPTAITYYELQSKTQQAAIAL